MATKARPKRSKRETPRPPRKPRVKQPFLPGAEHMAPVQIQEIDSACEDYRAAKKAHKRATEDICDTADILLKLLHAHKLTEYDYDGHLVKIAVLEKLKMQKLKMQKKADLVDTANGEADSGTSDD